MSIVRAIFTAVIEGASILGQDLKHRARLIAALQKLPPVKIGQDGTIQEWIEDYEEQEAGHRHISYLIGLHPFSLMTAGAGRVAQDSGHASGDSETPRW
jgi:alpha-L-fucosidase 2